MQNLTVEWSENNKLARAFVLAHLYKCIGKAVALPPHLQWH